MVISLLVLLVPVMLLIGGYQLLAGRTQPVEVDPAPTLAAAEAAGLPVSAPTGLPDDWVPVSAVFRRTGEGLTLRVGYVTPGGGSTQLVQSTVPAERLLPAELPEAAAPAGSLDLAGRSWQRYQADAGRALVLLEPDRTVIVVGAVEEAELRTLAAALA
jgi:hypothetical protein